ncbi:MAG TPA: AAA family ATPase [Planctomycetaceae bacterium]|nr:AAA family ATPase [Planctomycetaceae bacterium]
MTRNQRDKDRRERELAEERAALEEDLHRYDDIDPGLNEACRQAFPDAADRFGPPSKGGVVKPAWAIPPLGPGPEPDPRQRRAAFPGRPEPADFDLRDDCLIERGYRPNLPPRPPSPADRDKVDLYPIVQSYATIDKLTQTWLWPGRIPLRKITLLAGDPSVGKSRLAIDMAARVSAELPWPDDPLPAQPRGRANVLLFTAEDAPEDSVRQRLERAGANLDRVFNFRCVGERCRDTSRHATRQFRIPEDIPGLEDILHEYEPVGLVVIDTLADFWSGGGMQHNAQVRARLAPLVQAASRRGSAILCIAHLNKRVGLSGLYRTMDSLAFTAVARAVWGVAADPDQPERRLFLPVKTNLTAPPTGLAFRIVDERLEWEPAAIDETWRQAVEPAYSTRELQRRERQKVDRWLRDVLAEGETPAEEVIARSKVLTTRAVLRRVVNEAAVVLRFERHGDSVRWMWSLPK